MKRYFIYLIIFTSIAIFTHKNEIFNDNIIYGDNFYHYLIYTKIEKGIFEKDLINTALDETSFKKKLIFNPLILVIYTYFLKFFETPKPISLSIAIISQILSSLIFMKLLIKTLPNTNIKEYMIFSILFSLFISTTDYFFSDLRRNIAFLFFMAIVYNFYTKNEKILFISIFLYLTFYSVTIPFIFLFLLIYMYQKKTDKKYILGIIIMTILLLTTLKTSDLFKDHIYKISKAFEWKNNSYIFAENMNFFEKYIFNFNDYPLIHKFFSYNIILYLIISSIIIFKENKLLLKKIIQREEVIIFISALISFIISAFIISPAFASKQMMFTVPFLLVLIFIKVLDILIKIRFKKIAYFFLFSIIILISMFIPKIEHFVKIELTLMKYIKNNIEKNAIILAHPSEHFIPYYTKKTMYVMKDAEQIVCPISNKYCKEVERRYEIATDIYYLDSINTIKKKVKQEKIDYIIVDTKYYTDYILISNAPDKATRLSYLKYKQNKNKKFQLLEYAIKYGKKIGNSIYIINTQKIL